MIATNYPDNYYELSDGSPVVRKFRQDFCILAECDDKQINISGTSCFEYVLRRNGFNDWEIRNRRYSVDWDCAYPIPEHVYNFMIKDPDFEGFNLANNLCAVLDYAIQDFIEVGVDHDLVDDFPDFNIIITSREV